MGVDYPRLMAGLDSAAVLVDEGAPGLAALEILTATAREATGAGGATFTEYRTGRGRVTLASGSMAWALGQPVDTSFVDPQQSLDPELRPVESLPAAVAEPLLARGVGSVAVGPVRTGAVMRGAFHVFFTEGRPPYWHDCARALRLIAHAAQRAFPQVEVGDEVEEEDRSLFLAVAGHELRTPVTVVKGYANMLADRWESLQPADRREAAKVISKRADELARLVDRLLGAAIGDDITGRLVRTVPFDLVEALIQAARSLPAELARAVRLELPSSLPAAVGDPAVLTSIVAELVTNAVRYTPQGGPAALTGSTALPGWGGPALPEDGGVEVQAGADAHTVYLRVCDRGVGIVPSEAERAFDRFWRARRDADARGGVGLGLYLVRRLVERQNGWVSLRARDGGGTVAEVRLPRADGPLRRPALGEA